MLKIKKILMTQIHNGDVSSSTALLSRTIVNLSLIGAHTQPKFIPCFDVVLDVSKLFESTRSHHTVTANTNDFEPKNLNHMMKTILIKSSSMSRGA